MPSDLTLAAQTAFAQVAEVSLSADQLRSAADLPGSFAPKMVKGHKYWYYQYSEPSGARRQLFVGPDNAAVQAVMEKAAAKSDNISGLVRSAVALGCAEILPKHFKVLRRLSDYGFFRVGGVLIGTHAFICYGNMLGVRWNSENASRTQDIDFAHAGKNISLALASGQTMDIHSAIESLEMGFLPITTMAGKTGGAYLIPSEKEFRLDFLTTVGREGEAPYPHPDLGVTLQPLKFMEFSLEGVQQCPLLCGAGAVLVNLPHPARYALHKLIVAGLREGAFTVKASKDLMQAGLLLQVLRAVKPWDVEEAWEDLCSRGPGWISRARRGLEQLDKLYPADNFKAWLQA